MLNYNDLDRFARTPLGRRITISVAIIILTLVAVIIRLDHKLSLKDKETENVRQEERKERKNVEADLKACNERERINESNATKAAQKEAEEFKALYLKTMQLEAKAKQKNIIQ